MSCTQQSPGCLSHHADPRVPLTTLLVIRAVMLTWAQETIHGQGFPSSFSLTRAQIWHLRVSAGCSSLQRVVPQPLGLISLCSKVIPGCPSPAPLSMLPYSVLDLMSFRRGTLLCHTACLVSRPSPHVPGPALVLWWVTEFDKTTFQPCSTGGFSFPPGTPINPSIMEVLALI